MRVDDNLGNTVSSASSRGTQTQRIESTTAQAAGGSNAGRNDRVDLSSLTGRISESLQALSRQTAERVSRLQVAFSAGNYQPDPVQVSRAMLSGMPASQA
jgi:anti-sigma28 factor (negative regulator of flagellin synthesis)